MRKPPTFEEKAAFALACMQPERLLVDCPSRKERRAEAKRARKAVKRAARKGEGSEG